MEKWWHMGNIKPFKLKQLMWLCSVNERCHHLIRHGYTGSWGTALSSRILYNYSYLCVAMLIFKFVYLTNFYCKNYKLLHILHMVWIIKPGGLLEKTTQAMTTQEMGDVIKKAKVVIATSLDAFRKDSLNTKWLCFFFFTGIQDISFSRDLERKF